MPQPSVVAPSTTRRAALAAGGIGLSLVLTACGDESTRTTVRSADQAAPESDEAILSSARSELTAALARVGAVRRRHRSLRARLAPLQRAHEAQRAAIDPESPADAPPADAEDVPADPGDALRRVRRDEERLQRRLVTWAVATDSGPLARLLAATSAGIAQQLAMLGPDEAGP